MNFVRSSADHELTERFTKAFDEPAEPVRVMRFDGQRVLHVGEKPGTGCLRVEVGGENVGVYVDAASPELQARVLKSLVEALDKGPRGR